MGRSTLWWVESWASWAKFPSSEFPLSCTVRAGLWFIGLILVLAYDSTLMSLVPATARSHECANDLGGLIRLTMVGRLQSDSGWSGTFRISRVALHDCQVAQWRTSQMLARAFPFEHRPWTFTILLKLYMCRLLSHITWGLWKPVDGHGRHDLTAFLYKLWISEHVYTAHRIPVFSYPDYSAQFLDSMNESRKSSWTRQTEWLRDLCYCQFHGL